MKRQSLLFGLTFMLLIAAFPSFGQVTITETTFPRAAAFSDVFYVSTNSSPSFPSEGPDQIWDYSDLTVSEVNTNEYMDGSNNPAFPGAYNFRERNLIFQGFPIPSDQYEGLDSEGWYELGRTIVGVSYSITAISGGANDSLGFPGNNIIFEGRNNTIQFPLNYEDAWSNARIESTPFELTIAAFGLDHTPGELQRTLTDNREVVGYGSLTIPDENGDPTVGMDVLLVKVARTIMDSVFLGGAPAPDVLLAAFGLTQGAVVEQSFYVFYKPDFGSPVMSIAYDEDFAVYRPQAAATVSGSTSIQLQHTSLYPNPVSARQMVYLTTESPVEMGVIRLLDLQGRVLHQEKINFNYSNQIEMQVPAVLGQGLYVYQLLDQKGQVTGVGKLHVIE